MPLPPDLSKPAFSVFPYMADRVMSGLCVTCNSDKLTNNDFRNSTSRKEYSITGMCQECQDSIYEDVPAGDEDIDWNSADEMFEG